MKTHVKKNLILYCVVFLLTVISSIYVFAQSDKIDAVTIPPPLEGIEKPYIDNSSSQSLEIANIKIYTADDKIIPFSVELAVTKAQQNKGMMFRDKIEPNTGMLFLFEDSSERAFWMKNTFIPLDIIFIREDGVIHNIAANAVPKSLKSIRSNGDVRAVLEIGGGEASRLGISLGDRVIYDVFQGKVIK